MKKKKKKKDEPRFNEVTGRQKMKDGGRWLVKADIQTA